MSEKEMAGFDGSYGDTCIAFIEYRRSLGYKYEGRIVRAIRELNRYLNEHAADDTINLTKELVLGFAAKREGEQPMTQMRREALIRQLATYLNSIGVPAYVLSEHQHERCSFVPYIFTREQICSLLKAADSLPYAYRSPNMYNVYPFLIRLLYCCGLRISEALSLKISDIDFTDKVITVRQSKYNNTRLVPMSESLFACLRNYMNVVRYSENDTESKQWKPMGKSISNLYRYAEVSKACNLRFLDSLVDIVPVKSVQQQIGSVCSGKTVKGKRVPGFNVWSPDVVRIMETVCDGRYLVSGFRNRDIGKAIFPGIQNAKKLSSKTSRTLKKLRQHGLIKKVPRSRRYHVTSKGRQIMGVLLELYHKDYPVLIAKAA